MRKLTYLLILIPFVSFAKFHSGVMTFTDNSTKKGFIEIPDDSENNKIKFRLEEKGSTEKYPLEHSYMFYLGIMFGGNLLTKFVPESKDFFKFDNSSKLVKEFKDYINKTVDTKEKQDSFIKIVNDSYNIIALIFDEFYKKHIK